MCRAMAGLCALVLAIVPVGSSAASQPEADGKAVISYMLRMLNAQSMIKNDIRSGKYPEEALPLMEEVIASATAAPAGLLPALVV